MVTVADQHLQHQGAFSIVWHRDIFTAKCIIYKDKQVHTGKGITVYSPFPPFLI